MVVSFPYSRYNLRCFEDPLKNTLLTAIRTLWLQIVQISSLHRYLIRFRRPS